MPIPSAHPSRSFHVQNIHARFGPHGSFLDLRATRSLVADVDVDDLQTEARRRSDSSPIPSQSGRRNRTHAWAARGLGDRNWIKLDQCGPIWPFKIWKRSLFVGDLMVRFSYLPPRQVCPDSVAPSLILLRSSMFGGLLGEPARSWTRVNVWRTSDPYFVTFGTWG